MISLKTSQKRKLRVDINLFSKGHFLDDSSVTNTNDNFSLF